MKVYVVLAYDEDWYTFESFLGVFHTKEEAENYIKQDVWGNHQEHQEYKIIEEKI